MVRGVHVRRVRVTGGGFILFIIDEDTLCISITEFFRLCSWIWRLSGGVFVDEMVLLAFGLTLRKCFPFSNVIQATTTCAQPSVSSVQPTVSR